MKHKASAFVRGQPVHWFALASLFSMLGLAIGLLLEPAPSAQAAARGVRNLASNVIPSIAPPESVNPFLPSKPLATRTVTTTSDSGAGSLRQAILDANPAGGDTIVFSLTLPSTITVSSQLNITASLTISGPGASSIVVSGGGTVRVMEVYTGTSVTLLSVTIKNGYAPGDFGGGIWNLGDLTVTHSSIISNTGGWGGGIANNGLGSLTVLTSTISANVIGVASDGAGIVNYPGGSSLIIMDSTFANNIGRAFSYGGAIENWGPMTVTGSTLFSNQTAKGGAIYIRQNSSLIANSTLYNNTALNGGALWVNGGDTRIINSTFYSNSVPNSGLGETLYSYDGTTTFTNTIIAKGNTGGNCHVDFGSLVDGGNNLEDASSCSFGGGTGSNTNPLLGPLAYNGGATQTLALLPGSPAIDAGTNSGCPSTDQRGRHRPFGAFCDIGAYERGAFLYLPFVVK